MLKNQKTYSLLILVLLSGFAGCNPADYVEEEGAQFSYLDNSGGRSPSSSEGDVSFRTLRIGDRFYVKSVFENVFGPTYNRNAIVVNNIIKKQDVFGGNCDPNEGSFWLTAEKSYVVSEFEQYGCYGNKDAKMIMASTTLREGWRTRACEETIEANAEGITYAMAKAKVDIDSSPDYSNLNRIYQLFYPLDDLDSEVATELISSFSSFSDAEEFWKSMLLTVCLSPAWQVP